MMETKTKFFERLESPKIHLRKIWLCRFPIFFSAVLLLIGPIGLWKSSTILGNGFLLSNSYQMGALTVMSLICATLLLMQMLVILTKSIERFEDLQQAGKEEASDLSDPIRQASIMKKRWKWNRIQTCYWLLGGFSFPVTCWLHSMHQAGGNFTDDPEMSFESGLLGLLIGVTAYFLLLQVAATIDLWIAPNRANPSFFPTQALAKVSVSVNQNFQNIKQRFQDGHFELALSFFMLLVFYVALFAWSNGMEMTPEDTFTSPFYLILMLSILSLLLSAMSFFLDYYRVPTLFAVFCLLLSGYMFSSFDHRFPVIRKSADGVQESSAGASAIQSMLPAPDGAVSGSEELQFLVVAPGGGIHASAWTGKVLTGLHERYDEEFAKNLKLISAVSGGAVGSMFYLDHFPYLRMASQGKLAINGVEPSFNQAAGAKFRNLLRTAFQRSSTSSLEALAWGATFPDTARLILGDLIQEDRGLVQERRWLRRMDVTGTDYGPTLLGWKQEADANRLPYVVFNATEAETGRRVLFSTYQFKPQPNFPEEAQAIDFLTIANDRFDLPISTAVRLSATFPYAASAAMPAKDTLPLGHVVDGGYVDNEGLLTAVEYIRSRIREGAEFEPKQNGNAIQKKVTYVIIRILHTPPVQDHLVSPTDPGFSGSGWEYASVGPLMAMSNVRVTSQRERGEIELELLKKSQPGRVKSVVLQFNPPSGYKAPPLNWKLSPKQRSAYETAWSLLTNDADQALIEKTVSKSTEQEEEPMTEYVGLAWLDETLRRNNYSH